jgi:hypothetical protein
LQPQQKLGRTLCEQVNSGQATLIVESSDPQLHKELNELIPKLEKDHNPTEDDDLFPPL